MFSFYFLHGWNQYLDYLTELTGNSMINKFENLGLARVEAIAWTQWPLGKNHKRIVTSVVQPIKKCSPQTIELSSYPVAPRVFESIAREFICDLVAKQKSAFHNKHLAEWKRLQCIWAS